MLFCFKWKNDFIYLLNINSNFFISNNIIKCQLRRYRRIKRELSKLYFNIIILIDNITLNN